MEVCPYTILIADSQARIFESGKFNILSLPGAGALDVYDFITLEGIFHKNIFSSEGTIFFDGCDPSSSNPQDVARENAQLAKYPIHRSKKVFVLGIPERNENNLKARAANDILAKRGPKKEP